MWYVIGCLLYLPLGVLIVNLAQKLYYHLAYPMPLAGDEYVFTPDKSDPFPSRYAEYPHAVLEVKNGWVRYRWSNTYNHQDERMELRLFQALHRKVDKRTL